MDLSWPGGFYVFELAAPEHGNKHGHFGTLLPKTILQVDDGAEIGGRGFQRILVAQVVVSAAQDILVLQEWNHGIGEILAEARVPKQDQVNLNSAAEFDNLCLAGIWGAVQHVGQLLQAGQG